MNKTGEIASVKGIATKCLKFSLIAAFVRAKV